MQNRGALKDQTNRRILNSRGDENAKEFENEYKRRYETFDSFCTAIAHAAAECLTEAREKLNSKKIDSAAFVEEASKASEREGLYSGITNSALREAIALAVATFDTKSDEARLGAARFLYRRLTE